MSKLETNTIDTVSGTTNLTIGSTNTSTITVPNGKLTGQNYPAFKAYNESTQTLTDDTFTKIVFDTEVFDTDSTYDNSTNYRFTPNVAGKYFVFSQVALQSDTNTSIVYCNLLIYKNGSSVFDGNLNHRMDFNATANYVRSNNLNISSIIDMNGTTDYLEIFGRINVTSGTPEVSNDQSQFSAYRIGA